MTKEFDLKAWRETERLSQRAAAAKLGVALPTYQAWERGKRFSDGKPVEVDRRTVLACLAITAKLDERNGA